MEENKKRMEELNLTKLSQSLLSKPSPVSTHSKCFYSSIFFV
jgi:hypothetical protein